MQIPTCEYDQKSIIFHDTSIPGNGNYPSTEYKRIYLNPILQFQTRLGWLEEDWATTSEI